MMKFCFAQVLFVNSLVAALSIVENRERWLAASTAMTRIFKIKFSLPINKADDWLSSRFLFEAKNLEVGVFFRGSVLFSLMVVEMANFVINENWNQYLNHFSFQRHVI